MIRYKVFDIFWETDGHDNEQLKLPEVIWLSLEDDEDPDDCIPNVIFDRYSWDVNAFDYEEV